MKPLFIACLLPAIGIAGVCSNTSLGNGIFCVQSNPCSGTSITTLNCSFASTPAIGNTILVAVGTATSLSSVVDNQAGGGNTYHLDTSCNGCGSSTVADYIESAIAVKSSGTFTVTANIGTSNTILLHIYEISGLASSPPNDAAGTNGTAGATSLSATTSTTPVQNIELIFASSTSGIVTVTVGAGFTILESASAGVVDLVEEYKTVVNANSGTQSASFTYNPSVTAGMGVSTYKTGAAFSKAKKLLKYGIFSP